MKYDSDIQKSAEYLRQALPLMTKQATAMHPTSYAVWYEFVAGINPGLTAELNALIAKGQVLDEAMTESLYRRYIAEIDEATANRISARFQKVLTDISESTEHTGRQASQFDDSLEQLSEELSNSGKDAALDSGNLSQILGSARNMRETLAALKNRLDESQRETAVLRKEVSRAREEALTDGLTGLTNRKGFDRKMAECMALPDLAEKGLCLLMIDIDHFKKINDTYGHMFGDKVIRAIGQIINQNVKNKDMAARYGGEEFVVLLPETPLKGAQSLAETLRAAVEASRIKRTDNDETVARVTTSFGVASYIAGETGGSLIERADKALYQSKTQGRNRVTVAADEDAGGADKNPPAAKPPS